MFSNILNRSMEAQQLIVAGVPEKPLYIFDLDGTLCDVRQRLHFIEQDPPQWQQFFDACIRDYPIKTNIQTLKILVDAGAEIQLWSGRDASVRDKTVMWLSSYGITEQTHYTKLNMRPAGSGIDDVDLKQGWYNQLNSVDKARLVAVFDDRDKVVDMWRQNAVACYQVARGDF